jgi:phosphomannomutase
VREGGHEIGIGFDGDGDRIGVVDGRGRIVFGDQILQVLAPTCWSGTRAPRSSPT